VVKKGGNRRRKKKKKKKEKKNSDYRMQSQRRVRSTHYAGACARAGFFPPFSFRRFFSLVPFPVRSRARACIHVCACAALYSGSGMRDGCRKGAH